MKIITPFIFWFFVQTGIFGRNEGASPTLHIFQQITLSLTLDYLQQGKPLPISFAEIPLVAQSASGQSLYIKNLNNLAIIPNAPTIQSAQGITNDRCGYRLFAMARASDLESPRIGRLVVLIEKNGLGSLTNWIPEPEIQIILKQLKGFDPAKQPLAFQDLAQDYRKNQVNQEGAALSEVSTSNGPRPTSPAASNFQKPSEQSTNYVPFWIGGGILFVSLVTWNALRLRKLGLDKKRTESARSRNK